MYTDVIISRKKAKGLINLGYGQVKYRYEHFCYKIRKKQIIANSQSTERRKDDKLSNQKKTRKALARQLSWLEHHLYTKKIVGSNPGQGTRLDCRFDPQPGVYGRQLVDVFLSLPLSRKQQQQKPDSNTTEWPRCRSLAVW